MAHLTLAGLGFGSWWPWAAGWRPGPLQFATARHRLALWYLTHDHCTCAHMDWWRWYASCTCARFGTPVCTCALKLEPWACGRLRGLSPLRLHPLPTYPFSERCRKLCQSFWHRSPLFHSIRSIIHAHLQPNLFFHDDHLYVQAFKNRSA